MAAMDDNFYDYDYDFFRGAIPARMKREEAYHNEMELNLTLSDIDMNEEPGPFIFELGEQRVDVNDHNSCCHKAPSDKDGGDNESTFISYLPEPDQSYEIIPFD